MAEEIQKNVDEEKNCVFNVKWKMYQQKILEYEWMDIFAKTCLMLSLCSNQSVLYLVNDFHFHFQMTFWNVKLFINRLLTSSRGLIDAKI